MKIKALPKDERPIEKALGLGIDKLSNSELLGVIIGSGTRNKSAISLGAEVLSQDDRGMGALGEKTLDELLKISGIGRFKAVRIMASVELGKRIATAPKKRSYIESTEDVKELFMEKLRYEKREHFMSLLLSTKGEIISIETVSIGELSSAPVHPREVFINAVKKSAAGIIFVHNHPSGDPTPSAQDLEITENLVRCGNLLKINVIDHIIIGDGRYTSLRSMGKI